MADDNSLGLYQTDLIQASLYLTLAVESLRRAKAARMRNWWASEEDQRLDDEFEKLCDRAVLDMLAASNMLELMKKERIKIYLERKK